MFVKHNLIFLSLLITLSLTAQNQLISPFLGDIIQNQATTNHLMQKPTTLNINYINLDLSILNNVNNLQLTFDNQNYTVSNDSILQRGHQNFSWFGSNTNGDGYIIISVLGNDVQGVIRKGIDSYRIVTSAANLRKVIVKIDQSQYPQELCTFPKVNKQQSYNVDQNADKGYLKKALDTGCPLRALIMYTPAAEADLAADGTMTSNIINEIYNTVEEMNRSFINSEITNYSAVEIALIQEWNYTENVDMAVDLNSFKNDNYVKSLRETYDADFCMLIGEDSEFYDGCGIANTLQATYNTAFGVVANNCMKTFYTFAHELGHLLGTHHNVTSADTAPPKAYAHGYIHFPGLWRTIMSYNAAPCGNTLYVN